MLNRIRKSKISKFIAVFIAILLFNSIIEPMKLFALTSGPSQPEVQSFEPIGTTDMVNLFNGDFVYNIPLFEIPGPDGGYPFNISYHSGITMEQEASWVGLGWSLNPGAINRDIRNVPDEFDGECVTITKGMKPNITYGGNIGFGYEFVGLDWGKLGLSTSIMPYYNNYKGFGMSIGTGFNVAVNTAESSDALDPTRLGAGLGLTLDSQQGVGANASLSITGKQKSNDRGLYAPKASIGVGYNSREGLKNISLTCSFENAGIGINENKFKSTKSVNDVINAISDVSLVNAASPGGTSSLSFTGGALGSLNQNSEFKGSSINLSLKVGFNLWGNKASIALGGFYNKQELKNNYSPIDIPTYGYLNIQDCFNSDGNNNYDHKEINGIGDFSREKDFAIYSKTKYLPVPSLNYDVYSVVGQGIGNMFRPKRSDFGIISDRYQKSRVTGYNLGGEIAPGNGVRWGIDLGFNYSEIKSGMWRSDFRNALTNNLGFQNYIYPNTPDYEPYYFKTYGEHNANDYGTLLQTSIYSEKPAFVKFDKNSGDFDSDPYAEGILRMKGNEWNDNLTKNNRGNRETRGVSILPILIRDIKESNSEYDVMSEMRINRNISSLSSTPITENDVRNKRLNHIAGFITTNSRGVRYIYGIPAYNKSQNEYLFSFIPESTVNELNKNVNYSTSVNPENVGGAGDLPESTDQYYSKTTLQEYPYAYLLTSVLGPDYVDIDNVPGPSDGDLGYWVKFDYVRSTDSYEWRSPYSNGSYLLGYNTDTRDDKASFIKGTKEIWYLKSVETKSHRADFILNDNSHLRIDGKGAGSGVRQHYLDKIKLYSKNELSIPLKTIQFNYNYSLCKNVPNSEGGEGKLTLTSIRTFYKDNIRNSLSPYKFEYGDPGTNENPNYSVESYTDRWGFYNLYNLHPNINPYIDQTKSEAEMKSFSKAWNLKKIILPSGGDINIDYESDDYAYVQDKVAMQMTEIVGISNIGVFEIPDPNNVVYFRLENQPEVGENLTELAKKYISSGEELYFRIKVKLKTENQYEYVAGYSKVSDVSIIQHTDGLYYGRILLDYYKDAKQHTIQHHPFSVAGWQHLRTNQPDLFYNDLGAPETEGLTDKEKANFVVSFITNINNDFATIFKGIYDHCADKHYCDKIYDYLDIDDSDPSTISDLKSWVRLKTPDKIKYGGGSRVKKLSFNNNRNLSSLESNEKYGQVYDYKINENGQPISSGVAEYEPLVGGDENPLRQPKRYFQHIPLKADNEFYAEEPFNESLYPGANVGYRKVTVTSLSTFNSRLDVSNPDYINNASPTGSVEYEFFTAKDFPIKVDETELSKNKSNQTLKESKLFIPLPFIGSLASHRYTATQGYSIILNDMHGKVKKISNINESGDEVNHVEYVYSVDSKDNTALNNKLDVILSDDLTSNAQIAKRDIGVEYDFITDMRESHSFSLQAGLAFNSEVMIFPPLPAFFPWPSYTQVVDQVRTIVTNKIIHKSGILLKVISKEGNSIITSENKYFDPVTGNALLTTTTNNFDQPVYKYNFPARWYYSEMGPASLNSGTMPNFSVSPWSEGNNLYQLNFIAPFDESILYPGDQLIITSPTSAMTGNCLKKMGTYLGKRSDGAGNTACILYSDCDFSNPPYTFKIVKSGLTNLNDINTGAVTTLADPTINRYPYNQTVQMDVPELNTNTFNVFDPVAINLFLDFFNSYWQHIKNGITPATNYYINSDPVSNSKFTAFANYYSPSGECLCIGGSNIGDPYYLNYYFNGSVMGFLLSDENCMIGPDQFYWQIDLFNNSGSGTIHTFPVGVNKDNLIDVVYLGYDNNYPTSYKLGFNTTNGQIIAYYNALIAQCGKFQPVSLSEIGKSTPSITSNMVKVDKVISFEASTYSDNWLQSNKSISYYSPTASIDNENPFGYGEKGIWKKKGSYRYIDKRFQSSGSVNISEDGYLNNVPIYAWNNNNFDAYNTKWRRYDFVKSYSPYSYEEERIDKFGNFNSALYGLSGEFMTALANNAKESEIGYEGFEDYPIGGNINQKDCSPGNIDIYHQKSNYSDSRKYDIIIAKGNLAVIDKSYSTNSYIDAKIEAYTIDNLPKENISNQLEIVAIYDGGLVFPNKTVIQFDNNKPGFADHSILRIWKGTISLPENHIFSNDQNIMNVVEIEHHTGKHSLQIDQQCLFEQNRLNLIQGQKYIFSAWVKVKHFPINTVATYALYSTNDISIKAFGNQCNFVGKIVNGWQKIEAEFTASSNNIIEMYASGHIFNGSIMFVDDIRISPKKSTMKTFVYNPDNYKLSAVLDENNYSTFYYYDQEGKLYLKKQETENGIVTIQESHSYLKQHP